MSNPITTYLLKQKVGKFLESVHPNSQDLGMTDNSLTQVQDRCLISQTCTYEGQKFKQYHLRLSSNAQSPYNFDIEFIYTPNEPKAAKIRINNTRLDAAIEINEVLKRFVKKQFNVKEIYVLGN